MTSELQMERLIETGLISLCIILGLLAGGLITWLIIKGRKRKHKLYVTIASASYFQEHMQDEDVKIKFGRKTFNNLFRTKIIVRNIGKKDILEGKDEQRNYINIEWRKDVEVLGSKIAFASDKNCEPEIISETDSTSDKDPAMKVYFKSLKRGQTFKLVIYHDNSSYFRIDARTSEYEVDLKSLRIFGAGAVARTAELSETSQTKPYSVKGTANIPSFSDAEKKKRRRICLGAGIVFAVIMFIVGYGGFVLLFEEALVFTIISFFAAYLGVDKLMDIGAKGTANIPSFSDAEKKKRRWICLGTGIVFAVMMFIVGYGGFVLLFDEALVFTVISFFAAYLGVLKLMDIGTQSRK